ncbi:hypothetical protein H8356DRAFT_1732450 [Neocallimastix lanati (nom. inval.)]|nr:hypothetical protein H8356DRAFT_1732450 [Neocallimastix sp. JGI-2020a]
MVFHYHFFLNLYLLYVLQSISPNLYFHFHMHHIKPFYHSYKLLYLYPLDVLLNILINFYSHF